jgi:hypothetical protein
METGFLMNLRRGCGWGLLVESHAKAWQRAWPCCGELKVENGKLKANGLSAMLCPATKTTKTTKTTRNPNNQNNKTN